MEALAAEIRRRAIGADRNVPVVDSTGLKCEWDFDLQYGVTVSSMVTGAITQEGDTLAEAIDKQLGLTLELSKAPQQVRVVEGVNEQPTPNSPEVAAALPPVPAPAFQVASIKMCDGTGPTLAPRFEGGGRVTARCMPVLGLIESAIQRESVVGTGRWYPQVAPVEFVLDNISVVAKAPAGAVPATVNTQQAIDILSAMLRSLLVERYKLAFHYEDRPMDAYTLVAVKPKLTKADPETRTLCTRLNSAGVKPGLRCQNMTMAQFAEQTVSKPTTRRCFTPSPTPRAWRALGISRSTTIRSPIWQAGFCPLARERARRTRRNHRIPPDPSLFEMRWRSSSDQN